MGGMRPVMIVEGHPAPDAGFRLRARVPCVQVNALVLQRPPKALDEDIVDAASLAVHRDAGAGALHAVRPGKGRELAALVAVHDLGRTEAVHRLVERLDTELGLAGIGDPPSQDLAGKPV